MYITNILLKNVASAHAFVHLCDRTDCLVEILQNGAVLDGKSIIGILSLDLTAPIRVEVHCGSTEQESFFSQNVRPFVCTPEEAR